MKLKKWPRFSDIFSFQPPSQLSQSTPFSLTNNEENGTELLSETENPNNELTPSSSNDHKEVWDKIRFDNAIRLLISVPTYLACFALQLGGVIDSIIPMTFVFGGFAALQIALTWIFLNSRFARKLDFAMSAIDLMAMSYAVYCTGGTSSPLYFIYFIPLLIHAFHRDWSLVIFNGVGGGFFYALAILSSMEQRTGAELTNLSTRLFFMLLTLGVASFALSLLKKKDAIDRLRLARLRTLTLIGRRFNQVSVASELGSVVEQIIKYVNEGLGASTKAWSRFILVGEDPAIMKSVVDPTDPRLDLKTELATHLCPATKTNQNFHLDDSQKGPECPIENFSFGSHLCVPIIGTGNEAFGVLFAASPTPKVFKNEEKQFLEYIARALALTIQRLRRMEELKKAVEMNSCVMATFIGSSRSLKETYASITEGVATILKSNFVRLMLWSPQQECLKTAHIWGAHTFEDLEKKISFGEELEGTVLEKKETFWTADASEVIKEKTAAVVCIPLSSLKGDPLGTITAFRAGHKNLFSLSDIETVNTFSARAALALENAILHQKEREKLQVFSDEKNTPRKAA